MVAGQRKVRFPEGDEVAGDEFAALMQQLEKRMLAIGAGRAPENRVGRVIDGQAVPVGPLAVAFHFKLLEVRGQQGKRVAVGENAVAVRMEEIGVP